MYTLINFASIILGLTPKLARVRKLTGKGNISMYIASDTPKLLCSSPFVATLLIPWLGDMTKRRIRRILENRKQVGKE